MMALGRRQVLKLGAASMATAFCLPLPGWGRSPGGTAAGAPALALALRSRPLMVVRISAAPPHALGAGPHGTRLTFAITGGDFAGARLRGRVLAGGGDWGVVRSDGVLELSLRATLETDDGAHIFLTFDGVRHAPPAVLAALGRGDKVDPSAYYFRTLPRFEAADERYAFLNRIVAVGHGESVPTGAIHTFYEVL
jgi:hypothetical protein